MAQERETEIAHPTDPYLQGDVLHLVNRDGENLDPQYGIIINADCDLAHCKIDGVVSYLPLFTFENYFRKFWVPAYINERRRELFESLAQLCSLPESDQESLEQWLKDEPFSDVSRRLALEFSVKEASIRPKLHELSLASGATSYDLKLLDKIIQAQGMTRAEALAKYARKALKTLGDGSFFINEVVGLDAVGFVARMKRVHSISADFVFPSVTKFRAAANGNTIYAIRIAKLTNLYRFKVAQLFAYPFSRIGLPDEITALNDVAVQAAIVSLGGDSD